MLIAENLKKNFHVKEKKGFFTFNKKTIEAVKNISIKIENGKIVGLLGINGAGKTTTIKMLTTLLKPTAGKYFIDNVDAISKPNEVKKMVNMIAGGERMIYWRLTAKENLWYFGQLYGVENNILNNRIDELLQLVGLKEKENIPVETFSKGMKQRLQIARGLINNPKYLFLDEPTIGLDVSIAKDLRKQVKHLAKNENKGILLTTHYMGEVEELCDYIYIIDEGEILCQGTLKELSNLIFNKKIFVLNTYENEKIIPIIKKELNLKDEIKIKNDRILITNKSNILSKISEICFNKNIMIKEMFEQETKLEDIILHLSKKQGGVK